MKHTVVSFFVLFFITIYTANTGYIYNIYIYITWKTPRFDVFALFIMYIDITTYIDICTYLHSIIYLYMIINMYILFGCHFPTRKINHSSRAHLSCWIFWTSRNSHLTMVAASDMTDDPQVTSLWGRSGDWQKWLVKGGFSKILLFENGTFYPEFLGRWCFQRLFSKKHSSFPQFWVEMILKRVES